MNTKQMVWAGTMAVGAVAMMAIPTFAQRPFLEKARKVYELDAKVGTCQLCHEKKPNEEPGKKNLNAYGKDIAADPDMKPLLGKDEKYKFSDDEIKILVKVMAKIESVDSDKDGATNKEELALGSNPGDPKNMPDKKALAKYRKDNPKK